MGGRNGYGAKLCAIFSTKFVIDTCDGKKKYNQSFEENLSILNKPSISNSNKQFTKITYYPDFNRFDMVENDDNIISILHKRAADIAAYNPKVNIYFNEELLNVRKFEDYISLFGIEEVFYAKISDNWEIGITNGKNTQISLVNGIATNSGGTHVTYISNLIANEIKAYLYKKIKGCTLTLGEIRSKFMVFICCKIANPTFETQTKETLTTKITAEITKNFKITDALIKRILKSNIVESILDWYDQKQNADANKLARELNKNLAKVKVDKLIDAKGEGKDRSKCTLALFEGDSAQGAFRVHRDQQIQGSYCLKGKFINAAKNDEKLIENKEAMDFMAAMGLKFGQKALPQELRYGKILIYTDADMDGYCITGLLLNFIFKYWPELFDYNMVYRVETPIVVSINLKNKKKLSFYNQEEYNKWLKEINPKDWRINYKKGLAALENDEYEEIILRPRMLLLKEDEMSKDSLNIWFGKDSELRKTELLKIC